MLEWVITGFLVVCLVLGYAALRLFERLVNGIEDEVFMLHKQKVKEKKSVKEKIVIKPIEW